MHHNLVWILWGIGSVTFAPIVTDSIGKYVTVLVEGCCCNCAANGRVTLEPVFSNSIPEVEGAIRSSSTESAVNWVERDGVDRVNICHVI